MIKNITFIFISFLLLSSFISNNDTHLWFPHELGVIQNCEGQEVSIKFNISTDTKKKIKLHSFEFNNNDYTVMIDNKKVDKNDTLYVNKKNSLELTLKYSISNLEKPKYLKFKTNLPDYLENFIKISHGKHIISSEEIDERKEQIINVSESCDDSIIVHFPFGGTISTVSLYKDSLSSKPPLKSISYGMINYENYMKFSKAEIGRYYVRFSSCHWGNNFWLVVK